MTRCFHMLVAAGLVFLFGNAALSVSPVLARNGGHDGGALGSAQSNGGVTSERDGTGPKISSQGHAKGKRHHRHSHGNKGGKVRGLDRADNTAGAHGDRGRDRAGIKQAN